MPNIVLDSKTARGIVECGTKKNRVLLYKTPKTERDKKYRFTETVQVQPIDYSEMFKTVRIFARGDYSTTIDQTTGLSNNTWKYDKDKDLYYANGYLLDWKLMSQEGRAQAIPDKEKTVVIWSSIKVLYKEKDRLDSVDDNLLRTNLNRMTGGIYWVVWMRDRWNLLAPCTWRNEEKIF